MSVPSAGFLDTSVFIAREDERPIAQLPMDSRVSVVTIGELQLGVLSSNDQGTRSWRADTSNLARRLTPVPINEWVMDEWARLIDS